MQENSNHVMTLDKTYSIESGKENSLPIDSDLDRANALKALKIGIKNSYLYFDGMLLIDESRPGKFEMIKTPVGKMIDGNIGHTDIGHRMLPDDVFMVLLDAILKEESILKNNITFLSYLIDFEDKKITVRIKYKN